MRAWCKPIGAFSSTVLVTLAIVFTTNAQTCAAGIDSDKKVEIKEYPLYEAPDYTDGSCVLVCFELLDGASVPFRMFVPVDQIDVQLRADGKNETSFACRDIGFAGGQCKGGTIFVPVEEDITAWQAEVARWKAVRQAYLDSLPKPKRILPKKR